MYYRAIRQLVQALRNIDLWLDRAEEHAARKKFEIDILLGARLTAIGRTADPDSLLTAVFGPQYAHKPYWPWEGRRYRNLRSAVSGSRALLGHQ